MRYTRPPLLARRVEQRQLPGAVELRDAACLVAEGQEQHLPRPGDRALQGDGTQAIPGAQKDVLESLQRDEDRARVCSASGCAARVEPAAPDPVRVGGGQQPAVVA